MRPQVAKPLASHVLRIQRRGGTFIGTDNQTDELQSTVMGVAAAVSTVGRAWRKDSPGEGREAQGMGTGAPGLSLGEVSRRREREARRHGLPVTVSGEGQ